LQKVGLFITAGDRKMFINPIANTCYGTRNMARKMKLILDEKLEEVYLTPTQAAALLGVYYSTVIKWIKRGKIKAYMVAERWRIPLTEVLKLINTGEDSRS
jgi:excisionase family DNA binding protein